MKNYAMKICLFELTVALIIGGCYAHAASLPQTDNKYPNIKVSIDASSIKYIYSHIEEILDDPAAFWGSDPAYKIIKKFYAMRNREVPYDEWKGRVSEVSKLSEKESRDNQYIRAACDVEAQADYFKSVAVPHVCSYLPDAGNLEIVLTVHLTAYTGSYRFMLENDLFINVIDPYWKCSGNKILNNLVQVLFQQGYRLCRGNENTEPSDRKLYSLLEYLQSFGMATYVGRQALKIFPAEDIPYFALLEDDSEVIRLRSELNSLYSKAQAMPEAELRKAAVETGVRGGAYAVFGAYMAKTIEERLGRPALVETVATGPLSFVRTYNSVAGENERIIEF